MRSIIAVVAVLMLVGCGGKSKSVSGPVSSESSKMLSPTGITSDAMVRPE